MPAGYNPTRRNRNIGTAASGRGRNNRLVIPRPFAGGRDWHEYLNPHRRVQTEVSGRSVTIFVEETQSGFAHACTAEDILHVLSHLPVEDWEGLEHFVLRQPSRKQRLLKPAWGRLFYSAELATALRTLSPAGPVVMLEAIKVPGELKWSASLQPDDLAELNRLRDDGHHIERKGRRYVISTTLTSVRSTQLYRTLLHEIGHWVDFLERVERPTERGEDFEEVFDAYLARPGVEREAFAHRYAEVTRNRLAQAGVVPFAPKTSDSCPAANSDEPR